MIIKKIQYFCCDTFCE